MTFDLIHKNRPLGRDFGLGRLDTMSIRPLVSLGSFNARLTPQSPSATRKCLWQIGSLSRTNRKISSLRTFSTRYRPSTTQILNSSEAFLDQPNSLNQSVSGGMLRLVAAWDNLASLLPPATSAGPAAETLLAALKLALAEGSRENATRALSLASFLAELAGRGLPLDAEAIAAGVLIEAGGPGGIPRSLVESRVGSEVARLLTDLRRVRALPARVDLMDDKASSALRELALTFYSVKASAVEVAARLHRLQTAAACGVPFHELQVAALEALQCYAPLGHALGMGSVSAELEDSCFRILFPSSYERTAAWLAEESAANIDTLESCKDSLRTAVESDAEFQQLAGGLEVHGRTKSLFSTLKKLLRLGDMHKGGRSRHEIYDLLGIRAVVIPRDDIPLEEAEERAKKACYFVQQKALSLWPEVSGRRKDYIAAPKANGYQSLHCTVVISPLEEGLDLDVSTSSQSSSSSMQEQEKLTTLELQIRTDAMHKQAEVGEAAHAAYKGGLDTRQVLQLRHWTDTLLQRASMTAGALPDASSSLDEAPNQDAKAVTAAAESLFRHLDLDDDGFLSPDELRHALSELGAADPEGSAAVNELMKLADANADGAVSLAEFLEFQKRVGLAQATSAVDRVTANLLDDTSTPPVTIDVESMTVSSDVESEIDEAIFLDDGSSPFLRARSSSSSGAGSSGSTATAYRQIAISNQAPSSSSGLHRWSTTPNPSGDDLGGTSEPSASSSSTSNKRRKKPIASAFIESSGSTASVSSLDETTTSTSISSSFGNSSTTNGTSTSASASNATTTTAQRQRRISSRPAVNLPSTSTSGRSPAAAVRRQQQQQQQRSRRQNSVQLQRQTIDYAHDDEVEIDVAVLATNGNMSMTSSSSSSTSAVSTQSTASTNGGDMPAITAAVVPRNSVQEVVVEKSAISTPPTLLNKPVQKPSTSSSPEQQQSSRSGGVLQWEPPLAVKSLMRIFKPVDSFPHDAVWALQPISSNTHPLLDAAGQPLAPLPTSGTNEQETLGIAVPLHGPCIIGGRRDIDCDVVLDVPTVSGRHIRLEVVVKKARGEVVHGEGLVGRLGPAGSRLMVMDLDSTNGTWLNRGRLVAHKEVPLWPGDIICLAEPGIAFQVVLLDNKPPSSTATATSVDTQEVVVVDSEQALKNGDAVEGGEAAGYVVADPMQRPAVAHALRMATALEAGAASRGIFCPYAADSPELATGTALGEAARGLLTSERYGEAYMLLLGGAMRLPTDGRIWSQLAALERQRARRGEPGSTYGTTRAFLRAADECFTSSLQSIQIDSGLDVSVSKKRRKELAPLIIDAARAVSSWARLELDLGNNTVARTLFRRAVTTAQSHPRGAIAGGASKILCSWASREWKLGEVVQAAKLCQEALDDDEDNVFAVTLLGNIKAEVGDHLTARKLFRKAIKIDEKHLAALQSWGRLEAGLPIPGAIRKARTLFRRALKIDPSNVFVLQAWGVAEARVGDRDEARRLLQECLLIDPGCRAALHALGKLEDDSENFDAGRELFEKVLALKPTAIETLSALGRLERRAGRLDVAEKRLKAALKVDAEHAPSLYELALIADARGKANESHILKRRSLRVNQNRAFQLTQVQKPSKRKQ